MKMKLFLVSVVVLMGMADLSAVSNNYFKRSHGMRLGERSLISRLVKAEKARVTKMKMAALLKRAAIRVRAAQLQAMVVPEVLIGQLNGMNIG